jgi:hypothetical protein
MSLVAELVERVVLLGAPISINSENWRDVRKVINSLIVQTLHYQNIGHIYGIKS